MNGWKQLWPRVSSWTCNAETIRQPHRVSYGTGIVADRSWIAIGFYGAACGVRQVSGYLSTLTLIPTGLGLTPALCMSVFDGKPELSWLRPTYCSVSRAMALPAQAGGAAILHSSITG